MTAAVDAALDPRRTAPASSWTQVGRVLARRTIVLVGHPELGALASPELFAEVGARVLACRDLADARRQAALAGPTAAVVLRCAEASATVVAAVTTFSRQAALVVVADEASRLDRLVLWGAGADHVLTTTSVDELLASLGSVLRHAHAPTRIEDVLRVDDLEVHLVSRMAMLRGMPLSLTVLEFDLLAYFLSRPGEVLRRERLLADVWGFDVGSLDTVTVHVRRLRMKVEQDVARPRLLQTVWGVGYRLGRTSREDGAAYDDVQLATAT